MTSHHKDSTPVRHTLLGTALDRPHTMAATCARRPLQLAVLLFVPKTRHPAGALHQFAEPESTGKPWSIFFLGTTRHGRWTMAGRICELDSMGPMTPLHRPGALQLALRKLHTLAGSGPWV